MEGRLDVKRVNREDKTRPLQVRRTLCCVPGERMADGVSGEGDTENQEFDGEDQSTMNREDKIRSTKDGKW